MDLSKWKCAAHNLVLPNRTGCPKCADRKRAELHASGVCDAERPRQPYDNGKHQGNATWYKKPPLGPKPNWLDLKLPSGRLTKVVPAPGVDLDEFALYSDAWEEHIKAHAEELNRLYESGAVKFSTTAKHEPPPVGAEVSWAEAERDMRARPEARYREFADDGYVGEFATRFVGDVCWFGDPGVGWVCKNDDDSRIVLLWRREPDVATGPAIGEECDWETAKRDMWSRSEARYRPNYPESNVHSIVDGSLLYHVGSDEGPIGPGMHEAKARSHRWVRLA